MNDAIRLLRELNPEPRPRHARARRRPVRGRLAAGLTAVAASALVFAFAVVPALSPSPSLVARAADALAPRDAIVHYTMTFRFTRPDAPSQSAEVWQGPGGTRQRIVFGAELEYVRDLEAGFLASREGDEVRRYPIPEGGPKPAGPIASDVAAELPVLLRRAADGDAEVRRLDDAEIDGRTVARLRVEQYAALALPGRPGGENVLPHLIVSIDPETDLPVRVEVMRDEDTPEATADFTGVERLPADRDELLSLSR